MDRSDTTPAHRAAAPQQAAGRPAEGRCSACLTWGQRVLAYATAAAVLLSGLNAFVQVWRVVFNHEEMPAKQRPAPGATRPAPARR